MYSGRKRYLYKNNELSYRAMQRVAYRFLKPSTLKESQFEKPYLGSEYQLIQLELPLPDFGGGGGHKNPGDIWYPPPAVYEAANHCGIVCFAPTRCEEPIWCHPSILCWPPGFTITYGCPDCSWRVIGPYKVSYNYFDGIDVFPDSELWNTREAVVTICLIDMCENICCNTVKVTCDACWPTDADWADTAVWANSCGETAYKTINNLVDDCEYTITASSISGVFTVDIDNNRGQWVNSGSAGCCPEEGTVQLSVKDTNGNSHDIGGPIDASLGSTYAAVSWNASASVGTLNNDASTSDSGTVEVNNGKANYSWSLEHIGDSQGFSLSSATTAGTSNTVTAAAGACGSAMITVTDDCGNETTGYVASSHNGEWVQQSSGVCEMPGIGSEFASGTNYIAYEYIEPGRRQTSRRYFEAFYCEDDGCPSHCYDFCNDVQCSPCTTAPGTVPCVEYTCDHYGEEWQGAKCYSDKYKRYYEWRCT